MANYREILRLHSLGISNKQVSAACHCSRTTVIDVLKRATEISLEWGSAKDLSDKEITDRLFPPGLEHLWGQTYTFDKMWIIDRVANLGKMIER